jgi:hypothetical protein
MNLVELLPKPHPWMPACAGMTEEVTEGVIPAKAGIQVFVQEEVWDSF